MAGLEFVDMMGDKLGCGKQYHSTHGYRAVGTARDASFVSYAETFPRPGVPFADQSGDSNIKALFGAAFGRGNVRLGACLGGAALAHTGLSPVPLLSFFRFDVLV